MKTAKAGIRRLMNDSKMRGHTMARNMTSGSITKHLMGYSIPMILGNLFQLTYNAVDSIIVGKFCGENALAAVGTANPIMNIIIFLIIGICMGSSVLMSEYYGANKVSRLKKELAATMILGGVITFIITIICVVFTESILLLIKTPKEILQESADYLRIIFVGLIFTLFYNVYAYGLRSTGDSKTPIYFLVLSAVLNGVLDLIMVGGLGLGVKGAAYSTIIAEAVSTVLCFIYIYRKVPMLKLSKYDFRPDKYMIINTLKYSWFTSMQQVALYVGKVMVQVAVNPLGVESIASFNAVNRVDDFAFTPQQSIGNGITTFTSQNRGAQKEDRIKKGFLTGLRLEITYWFILLIIVFAGAKFIMGFFVPDKTSDMISIGEDYLRTMAFFYLLPALTNGIQGYFRGMGKLNVTLMATVVQMIFRVILSFIFAPVLGITGIAYACFGGWVAMLIYEVPVYLKLRKAYRKE